MEGERRGAPSAQVSVPWTRPTVSRPLDLSEFLVSGLQARAEMPGGELKLRKNWRLWIGLGSWLRRHHLGPNGIPKPHSDSSCPSLLSHRKPPDPDSLPLTLLGPFLREAKESVLGKKPRVFFLFYKCWQKHDVGVSSQMQHVQHQAHIFTWACSLYIPQPSRWQLWETVVFLDSFRSHSCSQLVTKAGQLYLWSLRGWEGTPRGL